MRSTASRPAGGLQIDWPRLRGRCIVGIFLVLGVAQIYLQARGHEYGHDFEGGTWAAGKAVLHGASPFPTIAEPSYLLAHSNAFVTPPLLALVGAPFSLLPFTPAVIAFNLLCVTCLLGALRLLDVTDRGFVVVVLCSFPFVASLALGQPDGILALGAAAAWRWRASDRGAIAVGAILAAKLLAWPLVLWLLFTRRYRQAAVAAGSAGAFLLASWACVGFDGLGSYPRLLSADARAFGTDSHSFLTALTRSGMPSHVATLVGAALAVGVAITVMLVSRRSDLGTFTAAITLGILSSPIVWQHYLLLLFIAFAATRRLRDPWVWVLSLGLWLAPSENPATLVQAWLIPVLAGAIALRVGVLSRPEPDGQPVATSLAGEPLTAGT